MVDKNNSIEAETGASAAEEKAGKSGMLTFVAILSLLSFWAFALYYIYQSTGRTSGLPLLTGVAWGMLLLLYAIKKETGCFGIVLCSLLIVSSLVAMLLLAFLQGFAESFRH